MFHRIAATCFLAAASLCSARAQPNILWIVFEDISPEIGSYDYPYAVTPHLDQFATESVLYTNAYSNGGACAPARSTLISGMYPPGIGTHHMRSSGRPPGMVRAFTEYLRDAGYYTSNHSKTDYNWNAPPSAWDVISPDWRTQGWDQRGDKPFFTVVNLMETHSSQVYHPWVDWQSRRDALAPEERHDPTKAIVPPFYPDTTETREILARYADNITFADRIVGDILAKLEEDGLADDTIVFYYSDHGTGLPRSKGFQFESSIHVPLMIRFPEKYSRFAPTDPGGRVDRITAFIDFPATVLSLAGVVIPDHFQGRAFLGDAAAPAPEFAYGYRDRMDERYEMIRSVIDGHFHYIRNYFPHLPWFRGQTRLYPSTNPLLEVWHRLAYAGALQSPAALYMAEQKPREQIFDLRHDPDEMNNLASDPRYASVLSRFRNALREWQLEIVDLGFLPESQMWLDFDGPEYETVRRDAQRYPLERILETADSVGGGDAELPQQLASLQDEDPTVRFWAATAILAQASAGEAAKPALHPLLADPSVAVRTVAAQALCALDECDEALQVLVATLNHEQEYAVLRAANALDHLDERARPVLDDMKRHVAKTAALEGQAFFGQAPFTDWALRVAIGELEGTRLPGVVKLEGK